jgi:hypothetical protein
LEILKRDPPVNFAIVLLKHLNIWPLASHTRSFKVYRVVAPRADKKNPFEIYGVGAGIRIDLVGVYQSLFGFDYAANFAIKPMFFEMPLADSSPLALEGEPQGTVPDQPGGRWIKCQQS